MMSEKDNRQYNAELRFFGKIVAAATHEINNVFSIVNENTGLLADLLAAGGKKGVPQKKVNSINESIYKHIERGKGIISHLNKFSHSVDQETSRVELEEVVHNIIELSARYARQKKASFIPQFPDGKISLDIDAFRLRMAIFTSFSAYLDGAGSDYEVTIKSGKENGSVVLSLSGPRIENQEDKKESMAEVMGQLGGRFTFDAPAGKIKLVLPAHDQPSSTE